ncbi:Kinesin-like protein kif24 [Perkinsus olseni]|uniref:Kinesin-like protein kif24 n=1 Tax=Perkinsus olseni TaxID=32597 RepID=A0A7J6RC59_PEROL|nr:Kinesin-like protein kif24 [Perkinsus olseni]
MDWKLVACLMIRPPVGKPRPLGISSAMKMRSQSEIKRRRSSEGSNSVASDGYASSTASGRRALTPVPGPVLSSPRVRTLSGIVSPRGESVRRPKSASEERSLGKGKGQHRSTPKSTARAKVDTNFQHVKNRTPVTASSTQKERGEAPRGPVGTMRPFSMRMGSKVSAEGKRTKPIQAGKMIASKRGGAAPAGNSTTDSEQRNGRVGREKDDFKDGITEGPGIVVIEKGDAETEATPGGDLTLEELSPVVAEEIRWQKQVDSLTAVVGEKTEQIEALRRELKQQEDVNRARWEEISALRAEVESSKSALRKVTSSLKNQVRAREGRLQSLINELESKKGEISQLTTELEEARQQVIYQQERQSQFVATERARADKIAEKLERSEAERRAEVHELNVYYQQALHDLRTQNAAHEATIKQLDESLADIKKLLSTKEEGRSRSYDSPGPIGRGGSVTEQLEDHQPEESPTDRRRRSSVKERVRELEALSGGRTSGSSNSACSSSATVPGTSTPIPTTATVTGLDDAPSSVEQEEEEASLGGVLLDQAHECFTEALDLCSEDKFTLAMAVLEQALGYLSNRTNESLRGYPDSGDDDAKMLLSDIYGQQGVCQQSLGNIDQAIDCYIQAVDVCKFYPAWINPSPSSGAMTLVAPFL